MGRMDLDQQLYIDVVDRLWWGEIEPDRTEMLKAKHPFIYVRFAYDDLNRGDNPDLVDALMKWEQRLMKDDQQLPDIPYNFLIGPGNVVYEGRGWEWDADRPIEHVSLTQQALDIAYIGDYSKEPPPWEMVYTAHNIILFGLKEKMIWEEFRVIPYSDEKGKKFV